MSGSSSYSRGQALPARASNGQAVLGSIAAAVCAYASVKFLTRYFAGRTLTPRAVHRLLGGAACVRRFG